MRQIRFAAIALVSFVAAIVSSFIDPGTFFNRTLSFTLCSVLGLTSNLCYANLARNSGDRAVAALPPTEQTQNTVPTLDFSPYLQSTRPEFEGSDVPAKPETSNPPSNSSPPQPSPSAPSNAPSPKNPSPEPSQLTPAGSTNNVPCNPTLLTASAQPAKQVIVKGVPTSFTELFAGVKADGLKSFIPTLARRLDNGDVAVAVPLHPTKGKAGGDVQLAIASGTTTCSTLSLRIEPLARAPGSAKKMLTTLQAYVNQAIQGTQISREQLMGNSGNLPQGIAPLALLQWTLDNPSNPNSLKAILDGTALFLKGKPLDIEVLDGLTENSGINKSLESLLGKVPTEAPVSHRFRGAYEVASIVGVSPVLDYLAPYTSDFKKPVNKPLPVNSTQIAIVTVVDAIRCRSIDTAEKLDSCMKKQREAEQYLNSPAYNDFKLALKIQAAAWFVFALQAISAAAVTGGAALPVAIPGFESAVAFIGAIGAVGFAVELVYNYVKDALPSELALTFDVSKYNFPKPDDPVPGQLTNVKLKAQNKGYDFTASRVIEFAGQFCSEIVGRAVGQVAEEAIAEAAKLVTEVKNSIVSNIAQDKKIGDPTIYHVPAETFVVSATPSVYPELIEAAASGAIVFSQNNDSYLPAGNPGQGLVAVRTKPGSFGGKQAQREKTITVGDEKKPQPQQTGQTILDPHLRTFDGLGLPVSFFHICGGSRAWR